MVTRPRRIFTAVTGSRTILRCGHEVTAEFVRSQIVTPVAAVSIAPMGVSTPWNIEVLAVLKL